MAPRKRQSEAIDDGDVGPAIKRRSARQAGQKAPEPTTKTTRAPEKPMKKEKENKKKGPENEKPNGAVGASKSKSSKDASSHVAKKGGASRPAAGPVAKAEAKSKPTKKAAKAKDSEGAKWDARAGSEDVDVSSIPDRNPDAERHDGEWYWLMKAEPDTRYENGIDVKFSIDDLRSRGEPEPWDGIRAYPARNNMRAMNLGDKAFFYHSNCKEPGIVGIMEIVKEYSEDKSARRPGAPYYDPSSTKEKPKWSLVHVKFVKKFAVPIGLKELREMGQPGKPLEQMQMLKQSRLSVSKVSRSEWLYLCEVADKKANKAGLEHETDD